MNKKLTREEIASELRTANAAYVKLNAEAVELRLKVRTLELELACEHEELIQYRLDQSKPVIPEPKPSLWNRFFGTSNQE